MGHEKSQTMYTKYKNIIWAAIIAIVTIGVYFQTINYDFVNWDDDLFVVNNASVHEISGENIASYFTAFTMEGYYPLTLLSLAIDYKIGNGSPMVFHIVNLILHLLIVLIVFWFLKLLTSRLEIAIVAALLFSIHPMHVESVAWITERKDLLYSLFYFLSLLVYLKYLRNKDSRFYIFSIILFIFSLLSKGQAVTLTIVLFVIDYFEGKKVFSKELLIQKIPFLVLSLILGIVAIFPEESGNIISSSQALNFSFFDRITLAAYSFVIYIVKLIIPYNLSAFYPYPEQVNGHLAFYYYLFIPIVLGVGYLIYLSFKKWKHIAFGLSFFVINIVLLLKLIPVTDALLADRYTYVSGLGIFYLIGLAYSELQGKKLYKIIGGSVFLIYVVFLTFFSFQRMSVWENSSTLFKDIIEKNPDHVLGYNNRGISFKNNGEYEEALNDFNKALEINPNYIKALQNRGITFYELGRFDLAINDLDIALSLDTLNAISWFNHGLILNKLAYFRNAIYDFNKSMELTGENAAAFMNIGNSYMGMNNTDSALSYYNKAIDRVPDYVDAITNRANLKLNALGLEEGYRDLTLALKLDPDNYNALFFRAKYYFNTGEFDRAIADFSNLFQKNPYNEELVYERGNCNYSMSNYQQAIIDYTIAIEINTDYIDAFVNRGSAYFQMNDLDMAHRNYSIALQLNPKMSDVLTNRGILYYNQKKYKEAIQDFSIALQINKVIPSAYYYRGASYLQLNRNKIACRDLEVAKRLQFADEENVYGRCR